MIRETLMMIARVRGLPESLVVAFLGIIFVLITTIISAFVVFRVIGTEPCHSGEQEKLLAESLRYHRAKWAHMERMRRAELDRMNAQQRKIKRWEIRNEILGVFEMSGRRTWLALSDLIRIAGPKSKANPPTDEKALLSKDVPEPALTSPVLDTMTSPSSVEPVPKLAGFSQAASWLRDTFNAVVQTRRKASKERQGLEKRPDIPSKGHVEQLRNGSPAPRADPSLHQRE